MKKEKSSLKGMRVKGHTKEGRDEAIVDDVGAQMRDGCTDDETALRLANEAKYEIERLRSGVTTFEDILYQKGEVSMVMLQQKLAKHVRASRSQNAESHRRYPSFQAPSFAPWY